MIWSGLPSFTDTNELFRVPYHELIPFVRWGHSVTLASQSSVELTSHSELYLVERFLFTELQWAIPSFTEFFWLLPGFTGFYRVCLAFTQFYWGCYCFIDFYYGILSYTGLHRVILGYTGSYWVLPGFIGFYRVILGCAVFWRVTGYFIGHRTTVAWYAVAAAGSRPTFGSSGSPSASTAFRSFFFFISLF